MNAEKVELYLINTDDIKEYENNPRNNDNAVAAVAASIDEFGFKVPLVVDSNYIVVAGHTRLKAAKQLGLQQVPCIIADDLTDEQIKAFRLADNKTGELAGWDFEKLDVELAELSEIDMSVFGFTLGDDVDIDDFFTEAEDDGSDEEEEEAPQRVQCPHCGEWFEV